MSGYTTRRHPRSIAEAWMRPPARQSTLQGPYRRRPGVCWGRWAYAGLVLALIAACGVLLG